MVALMDLTQRATRHMKARETARSSRSRRSWGRSASPIRRPMWPSKHAVDGLVKCLRAELRGTGVRVWAACPGRTASEFASVALGRPGGAGRKSGEPTAKIVRNILKGLDRDRRFVLPSLQAGRRRPGPVPARPVRVVHGAMGAGAFGKEIEAAGGKV